MLKILLAIIFEFLTALGLGSFMIRKLGWQQQVITLGETSCLGLFGLNVIALSSHLFVPISSYWTFPLSLGFAATGIWFGAKKLVVLPKIKLFLIVLAILPLILAWTALKSGIYYDTGLYHLPKMLWLKNEPVVLGLVNLHGRFGFPSVWQELSTYFWLPVLEFTASFSLNCTFVFILLIGLVEREIRAETKSYGFVLIALIVILILFRTLFFWQLGSPASDLPAALLSVLCTLLFLDAKDKPSARSCLRIFSIWAITIKLSQVPLLLMPIFLEISRFRNFTLDSRSKRVFILVGFYLSIWMATNILVSGCVVYPLAKSCISRIPWSVSAMDAQESAAWIRSWARWPEQNKDLVLSSWHWIKPWAKANFKNFPLVGSSIFIFVEVFYFLVLPLKRKRDAKGLLPPLLILCGGILFWFLQAPDFRFGYGYFASALIIIYGGYLNKLLRTAPHIQAYILNICILVICTFGLMQFLGWPGSFEDLNKEWPAVPQAKFVHRVSTSGQIFQKPISGDQCWLIETPCTPYFKPSLGIENYGLWSIVSDSHVNVPF